MLTTILGYFVVVQFFYLDRSRRGGEARSFEASEFDQRSTLYIGIAYFASMLTLLASRLLNWLEVGTLPAWAGAAAATVNWIVFLIVLVVMLGVYIYRMQNEEKMLLATNAEYVEYRKRTWRLIPLLY